MYVDCTLRLKDVLYLESQTCFFAFHTSEGCMKNRDHNKVKLKWYVSSENSTNNGCNEGTGGLGAQDVSTEM